MKNVLVEIGGRIKDARLKKSMSQEKLAELVGYKDKTAIAHIEAGRRDIPQSKLMTLAEVLGTSPQYLLYGDSDKQEYYINEGVAEIAQQIVDNPNMRALFDAARGCTPEDMQLITDMIERFKKTNPDG